MEIIEERFEDASEEDDYYYAGVILWIRDGRIDCKARSYDDEPERVSILKFEIDQNRVAGEKLLTGVSQDHGVDRASLAAVVEVLQTRGYQRIEILTADGYELVESVPLPRRDSEKEPQ
jgi:hypothetical protein